MLRLRTYERISRKSAILLQQGSVDEKCHVEGVAPTYHSFFQKTRLNDLSYHVKIWTDLSSILSQSTRLSDRETDGETDGRTDRILIARPRLHSMQRGKNLGVPLTWRVTLTIVQHYSADCDNVPYPSLAQ